MPGGLGGYVLAINGYGPELSVSDTTDIVIFDRLLTDAEVASVFGFPAGTFAMAR